MWVLWSGCKHRWSFPHSPAAHLLLCGPVPNRPGAGTGPWPWGLGTPALGALFVSSFSPCHSLPSAKCIFLLLRSSASSSPWLLILLPSPGLTCLDHGGPASTVSFMNHPCCFVPAHQYACCSLPRRSYSLLMLPVPLECASLHDIHFPTSFIILFKLTMFSSPIWWLK